MKARICRIEKIIIALETAMETAASDPSFFQNVEYDLDDGQTKIKGTHRNIEEITRSINAFEAIKQRLVNKINGHVVRLVDGRNMTRFYNGRY